MSKVEIENEKFYELFTFKMVVDQYSGYDIFIAALREYPEKRGFFISKNIQNEEHPIIPLNQAPSHLTSSYTEIRACRKRVDNIIKNNQ